MAVFVTPFGDNKLVSDGGNVTEKVHNQFGPRDVGGTVGVLKVEGMEEELVIDFDAAYFADDFVGAREFVLPAGAVIKNVYVDVEEVFALTGTTPTLRVGTDGSEATNGASISKAQLEAAGSYNVTSTLAGTWDAEAPLAASTKVGFALAGTTPAMGTAGKARITIQFYRTARTVSPAKP